MPASAAENTKPVRPSLFSPVGGAEPAPRISVLAALDPGMQTHAPVRASRRRSSVRGVALAVAGAGVVSVALAWALWRESSEPPVASSASSRTRPIQPAVTDRPASEVEASAQSAGARIETLPDQAQQEARLSAGEEPVSPASETPVTVAAPAGASAPAAVGGESSRTRSPIMRALTSSEASAPAARQATGSAAAPARPTNRTAAVDTDVLLLEALVSYSRRQQTQAEPESHAGRKGAGIKPAGETESKQP